MHSKPTQQDHLDCAQHEREFYRSTCSVAAMTFKRIEAETAAKLVRLMAPCITHLITHSRSTFLVTQCSWDPFILRLPESVALLESPAKQFPIKLTIQSTMPTLLGKELMQRLAMSIISLLGMDWEKKMYIYMQITVQDKIRTIIFYGTLHAGLRLNSISLSITHSSWQGTLNLHLIDVLGCSRNLT